MRIGCIYNSFTDSPSGIAIVFFFPRCSMRCPYCYNKSLVELPANSEMESGIDIPKALQEIHKCLRKGPNGQFLTRDWSIYSGGECTLYEKEMRILIDESKKIGQKVGIYSNGKLPESRKFLLDLIQEGKIDFLNIDFKVPISWKDFTINDIQYKNVYNDGFKLFLKKLIQIAKNNPNFTLRFATVAVKQLLSLGNYFEDIKQELLEVGFCNLPNISWRIAQFTCDDYSNIIDDKFTKRNSYIAKDKMRNIIKELKKDIDWNIEFV